MFNFLKKSVRKAVDLNKNYDIYLSEAQAGNVGEGYSSDQLNEYIIEKYLLAQKRDNHQNIQLQVHVMALISIIELVHLRLNKPLKIFDFGGGCPTIPSLLDRLGLMDCVENYQIIESPSFLLAMSRLASIEQYVAEYDGGGNLLILSSVLPYIDKNTFDRLLECIENNPPRYIYFGRTSFLNEDHPNDEVFTIQRSRFSDHGVQIKGEFSLEIEHQYAEYLKRHFKFSRLLSMLNKQSYKEILVLEDDSGLQSVNGLNLYTHNSLWAK
jgi:hypothetical protein